MQCICEQKDFKNIKNAEEQSENYIESRIRSKHTKSRIKKAAEKLQQEMYTAIVVADAIKWT